MTLIKPDRIAYLRSLGQEVQVQSMRVRNLIGGNHWPSDGHHKEYLLKEIISRHIPTGFLVTRGFVVDPTDSDLISTEQDLLVIDSLSESPLFNQGGLCVSYPHTVQAAISVKTNLTSSGLKKAIEGLSTVLTVGNLSAPPGSSETWCGLFFFELDLNLNEHPERVYQYIEEGINNNKPKAPILHPTGMQSIGPHLVAAGADFVYRLQYEKLGDGTKSVLVRVHGYKCRDLATSLFIAHLVDRVAETRSNSRSDFTGFLDDESADIFPIQPPSQEFTIDLG